MRLADLFPDAALPELFAARDVKGLSADSRDIAQGFVFFAVPGTKADGLSFAPQAVARGAMAIVAERWPEDVPADVACIEAADVRGALAASAARFYPRQPGVISAITGTSGKTSVAAFTRQIFTALGHVAASLGTLGVVSPAHAAYGSLTTPDPVSLHKTLDLLAGDGVTHLALEASSVGIAQKRLDATRITSAAFTNLSREHLDDHGTIENYFAAKLRLFDTLLEPGRSVVIDADSAVAPQVMATCAARGLRVFSIGEHGRSLRLLRATPEGLATRLLVDYEGARSELLLPLAGRFQVSNALVAAGLAIVEGGDVVAVLAALERLEGAAGRLERVGERAGAPIFVDYAHKPDALEQVLLALRPFATGRLIVVFGCGGNRDAGKRPIMGEVAARLADLVIVTDDNPRSEEPGDIRRAILAGTRSEAGAEVHEIGDRAAAIAAGVSLLEQGDVLLIAGKGHETGQILGDRTLPFSDQQEVRTALKELAALSMEPLPNPSPEEAAGSHVLDAAPASELHADNLQNVYVQFAPGPLWSALGVIGPLAARVNGGLPGDIHGISIDTRSLAEGDLFFAIKGERSDGHDHVHAALEKGAAAAVVDEAHADALKGAGPLYVVHEVLPALERLAQAARARTAARIVAVTGSVGKTSTKEALRLVLSEANQAKSGQMESGHVHASVASYNNHWGVPLTLARMPRETRFGIFEIGMNHAGEIEALVNMVRPHIAVVTSVAPVHLEFFPDVAAIADAKAEIFSGLRPGGVAIINRDLETYDRLADHARRSPAGHIASFGEDERADAQLLNIWLAADHSTIDARIGDEVLSYRMGAPGRHLALNSLAVLLAAQALGVPLENACAALAEFTPPAGRGERFTLQADDGSFTLIDESYNANPASMRAVLALAGALPIPLGGRRIAVLGDMRELGFRSDELHADLAADIRANHIDVVFAAGPLMAHLFAALPVEVRGVWRESGSDLLDVVGEAIHGGDIVVIKGSNASRMGEIAKALKVRFAEPQQAAEDPDSPHASWPPMPDRAATGGAMHDETAMQLPQPQEFGRST
jgi:murE/murF fusion protein